MKYCVLIDNCWGNWNSFLGFDNLYGKFSDIRCVRGSHPSTYCWRLVIDNYRTPTKDEIKSHRKNNKWFEYQGTFEYYITDEYPDLRSQLLNKIWEDPRYHDTSKGQTPCIKKTVRVKIGIAPYKKEPECYNIMFENGSNVNIQGFGFSIR